MPVGANIRIAVPGGEPPVAVPGEAASIEEMFGQIIAAMGETAAPPETAGSTPSIQVQPAQLQLTQVQSPPPQPADAAVATMVEQLIALAGGQADPAVDQEPLSSTVEVPLSILPIEEQPAARAPAEEHVSATLKQLLALVAPKGSDPLTSPGKLPSPERKSDEAAIEAETTAPLSSLAGAPILQLPVEIPQLKTAAPVIVAAENLPEAQLATAVPAALKMPVAPVEIEDSGPAADKPTQAAAQVKLEAIAPTPVQLPTRTDTAVQQAFSTLHQVVKELPAELSATALAPASRSGSDQESTPQIQDLKLAPLASLATINTPLAQLDGVPRPDNAQAVAAPAAPTQVDNVQLAIERQLDMAHEGEWLDQLAKDIAETASSDKNPLRFRLNPETLGTLRVEITQDRNGAAVRFTADTEAARTIIADAQPRLIAEARAQGIRISEAHVDLGSQPQSGDPRRQNAAFEEAPLRTARSLQDQVEGDGNPTPGRSERYA